MQPVNYMNYYQNENQGNSFKEGLDIGQSIQKAQLQNEAIRQSENAQKDLTAFLQKPNKTADDYNNFMIQYPSLREGISAVYKNVNEEKKSNDFNIAAQISGALNSGNTDLAKQIADREKTAFLNSGDTKSAQNMDNILQTISNNPKSALEFSNMFMASIYPDKFKDTYSGVVESNIKQQEAPLNMAKIKAEIQKTYSGINVDNANINKILIDAKKSAADIQKTNADTQGVILDSAKKKLEMQQLINSGDIEAPKLSAGSEKIMNDAILAASNSNNLATQYDNLSVKFDKMAKQYGLAGKGQEAVKQWIGNQDEITRLKNEFERIKNSTVIKMLPPGPATDRDVAIFSKPFPDANASPEYISSFLKSMSSMQRYDAKLNDAQAEWVAKNGNLGNLKKDITISGVKADKGASFNDFFSKNFVIPNTADNPKNENVQNKDIPKVDDLLKKYGGK